MQRPSNLKKSDQFRVIEGGDHYDLGEIVTLEDDNGSSSPYFLKADKSNSYFIPFSQLEPVTKTARDAQVGDEVIGKTNGSEYMVLERFQNTVSLSLANDFKKALGNIYTFDELEEDFTIKAEPSVDGKTAEAMEVLKEAGYKISKD